MILYLLHQGLRLIQRGTTNREIAQTQQHMTAQQSPILALRS
jgi:hypothetical protein